MCKLCCKDGGGNQKTAGRTRRFGQLYDAEADVDAEDAQFDDIMKQVADVCAKVEPDCKILF